MVEIDVTNCISSTVSIPSYRGDFYEHCLRIYGIPLRNNTRYLLDLKSWDEVTLSKDSQSHIQFTHKPDLKFLFKDLTVRSPANSIKTIDLEFYIVKIDDSSLLSR